MVIAGVFGKRLDSWWSLPKFLEKRLDSTMIKNAGYEADRHINIPYLVNCTT